MAIRKLFRTDVIITFVFLCTVAWGITVWYQKHEREARESQANRVQDLANMSDAESALGRLKNSWSTDESWEDNLTAQSASGSLYSIDFDNALVKSHPFIFLGAVNDIYPPDELGNSLVSIEVHGRKHNIRLRLSLKSASDITAYLLGNKSSRKYIIPELSKVTIFVATIDSVNKMTTTDRSGDDRGYFVADGTLHESYVTRVYASELFH